MQWSTLGLKVRYVKKLSKNSNWLKDQDEKILHTVFPHIVSSPGEKIIKVFINKRKLNYMRIYGICKTNRNIENIAYCSYLGIYISQKIRLCIVNLEGKFQINLQAKPITFWVWKFQSIICTHFFLFFFCRLCQILCFLQTVAAIPKSWQVKLWFLHQIVKLLIINYEYQEQDGKNGFGKPNGLNIRLKHIM